MRDITAKIKTLRQATAKAVLKASPETIRMILEDRVAKGDPRPVAKVSAIMAAKNTQQIIPYCHPVHIEATTVDFELSDEAITVLVTVKAIDKTGVEMEALTAASVAALTLYDMLKAHDEAMAIEGVTLLEKTGGKSDFKQPFSSRLRAAVIVLSDTIAAGKKTDRSGKIITERLERFDVQLADYVVIPDEPAQLERLLLRYCDEAGYDLILTTGGTGLSPRDTTPETVSKLIEREIPGITEASRGYGQERTPYSMLSRGIAGVRKNSLIITLPGSSGGVSDSLDALFPAVLHTFKMLWGGGHPETDNREPSLSSVTGE